MVDRNHTHAGRSCYEWARGCPYLYKDETKLSQFPVLEGSKAGNLYSPPPGGTVFELFRRNDESGVSGTGLVLQGIVYNDGSASVRWLTEDAPQSTVYYGPETNGLNTNSGWAKFLRIHVSSHPTNDVRIVFYPKEGETYEWNQRSDPKAIKEKLIQHCFESLVKLRELDPNDIEDAALLVYGKYLEYAVKNRQGRGSLGY